MEDRIGNKQLRMRVADPQEAAKLIKNGMTIGVGGFTASGYPKVIPLELVRRSKTEDLKLTVISAANVGPEVEDAMGKANIIQRRIPLQSSEVLRKQANQGKIDYVEIPLNKMPRLVQSGIFGQIDVAIVEAIGITKEGYIIPSSAVGMDPVLVKEAQAIIVEINTVQPVELEGVHDIYLPDLPPNKKPVPLISVKQRIGEPFIRVNPDKIKYIVESDIPDSVSDFGDSDGITKKISANLLNFLELEVAARGFSKLPPLQSGLGKLANSLLCAFKEANFKELEFYCGILQEANIELISQGKVSAASGVGISPSPRVLQLIRQDPGLFKQVMVLRPTSVSNNGEVIDRLGLISLNNAIEVDIYGNANTSHIMGNKVVNGIGGGGAFSQNAALSIMMVPSFAKDGDISTIVPMVSHNDINEHDLDVIITENGVADLRGKTPLERANSIIKSCAHPMYREQLAAYLQKCISKAGGHQPQLLADAFSWHLRLKETGSMKEGGL